MSGSAGSNPSWVARHPSQFDIVATYFPESENPDEPGPKLRPGLILKVYRGKKSGGFYCDIAYGTKHLKIIQREDRDLIIQNATDLQQFGLARATRFDLDNIATQLPWTSEFFGCWSGNATPVIGTLTEDYIRRFAYLMMKRGSV
jgi:hypothetical protein